MSTSARPRRGEVAGVGLGLRPELSADLLREPRAVDFLEVVVEACFASAQARREASALAAMWPVIPHGIKLSLGSADGIEEERAQRIGQLARELRAPLITEHVAFVRGGSREIGHLTQLPATRDAVKVVARNVAAARRHLPDVPLLLENVAWTFRWPDETMREEDFYAEVVAATGCDLLLDVSNLYANARNSGRDPRDVLRAFPLERVAMVHLAGGMHEGGFYLDTHAHPVPDDVFDLLALLGSLRGPVPVVLERDALFPPFADLTAELQRARAVLPDATPPAGSVQAARHPAPSAADTTAAPVATVPPPSAQATADLLTAQERIAWLLTGPDEPSEPDAAPYGEGGMARSREVLRRKRVDDALPLLPRLSQRRAEVEPLAYRCVAHAPRTSRMAAIADALRIAEALEGHASLRGAALVDGLVLRARFRLEGGEVRPRGAPFVQRVKLPTGPSVWVLKGPGTAASVRLFEPARSS